MNIIIAGGGKVGLTLLRKLCNIFLFRFQSEDRAAYVTAIAVSELTILHQGTKRGNAF